MEHYFIWIWLNKLNHFKYVHFICVYSGKRIIQHGPPLKHPVSICQKCWCRIVCIFWFISMAFLPGNFGCFSGSLLPLIDDLCISVIHLHCWFSWLELRIISLLWMISFDQTSVASQNRSYSKKDLGIIRSMVRQRQSFDKSRNNLNQLIRFEVWICCKYLHLRKIKSKLFHWFSTSFFSTDKFDLITLLLNYWIFAFAHWFLYQIEILQSDMLTGSCLSKWFWKKVCSSKKFLNECVNTSWLQSSLRFRLKISATEDNHQASKLKSAWNISPLKAIYIVN